MAPNLDLHTLLNINRQATQAVLEFLESLIPLDQDFIQDRHEFRSQAHRLELLHAEIMGSNHAVERISIDHVEEFKDTFYVSLAGIAVLYAGSFFNVGLGEYDDELSEWGKKSRHWKMASSSLDAVQKMVRENASLVKPRMVEESNLDDFDEDWDSRPSIIFKSQLAPDLAMVVGEVTAYIDILFDTLLYIRRYSLYNREGATKPKIKLSEILRCNNIQCNKRFNQAHHMREHTSLCQTTHPILSGTPPDLYSYHCTFTFCRSIFKTLDSLVTHENNSHQIWVCRAFNCDAGFYSERAARRHTVEEHLEYPQGELQGMVETVWTAARKLPEEEEAREDEGFVVYKDYCFKLRHHPPNLSSHFPSTNLDHGGNHQQHNQLAGPRPRSAGDLTINVQAPEMERARSADGHSCRRSQTAVDGSDDEGDKRGRGNREGSLRSRPPNRPRGRSMGNLPSILISFNF